MSDKLTCGAKKKNGAPCGAPPLKNATRCRSHGGASPASIKKASERGVEAKARQILGTIDPDAPQEHPVETLLKLINMKFAEVIWLRAKVQAMTEEELTWGLTEHKTGLGPEGPVDVETFRAEQNIWWKLLREAENQLAGWTERAAKAGVEERQLRINESMAYQFKTAIDQILDLMELSTEQRAMIPQVVPLVLRSIGG